MLAIIGLLAGLVGPQVLRSLSRAKSQAAAVQIEQFGAALELLMLDVGRFPTLEEGLDALIEPPQGLKRWSGPYLRKASVPLDPWGHPYVYRVRGDGEGVSIASLGADHAVGGEGENADVESP